MDRNRAATFGAAPIRAGRLLNERDRRVQDIGIAIKN
jgi:hypothetical protein